MQRSRGTTTARPPWRWALAGLFTGLAAAFVLHAPAHWVAAAIARASGGRVELADARGTLWNGSAQLSLTGGQGSRDRATLPGRVAWKLRLKWNRVFAAVRADCCMPRAQEFTLRPRWTGAALAVADSESRWPAALLQGLGTPWNTLQLEGNLQLATHGLSLEWSSNRLAVAGRAELVAQHVSSRLSTLRPMGSYRVTVQGGETPSLRLDTLEGSLQLTGAGQWVGSRLRFTGEATAAPEREAALTNLLNIIGRRNGPRSIITLG